MGRKEKKMLFELLCVIGAGLLFAVAWGIKPSVGYVPTAIKVLRWCVAFIIGLAVCFLLSAIGVIAGVIGLFAGVLLGYFLPNILRWLWCSLKFVGKLILVVLVLAALVAAIL